MLCVDQHDENGVSVVALRGQAGITETQALTEVIIPLAAARPTRLVFDLSLLTYISSVALGELASLAAALEKFGARLGIAAASPQIRVALHRMRLDHQYEMFDSVELALRQLQGFGSVALVDMGRRTISPESV